MKILEKFLKTSVCCLLIASVLYGSCSTVLANDQSSLTYDQSSEDNGYSKHWIYRYERSINVNHNWGGGEDLACRYIDFVTLYNCGVVEGTNLRKLLLYVEASAQTVNGDRRWKKHPGYYTWYRGTRINEYNTTVQLNNSKYKLELEQQTDATSDMGCVQSIIDANNVRHANEWFYFPALNLCDESYNNGRLFTNAKLYSVLVDKNDEGALFITQKVKANLCFDIKAWSDEYLDRTCTNDYAIKIPPLNNN